MIDIPGKCVHVTMRLNPPDIFQKSNQNPIINKDAREKLRKYANQSNYYANKYANQYANISKYVPMGRKFFANIMQMVCTFLKFANLF